jgi:hypothetical protein
MPEEPLITVNGIMLSVGQAMTLRVALSNFLMDLHDPEIAEGMGHTGLHYRDRANEIIRIMCPNPAKVTERLEER